MKKLFTILLSFCFFITNAQNSCTHTFNTYDSFGDGWNGASVDITVNGVTVLAGVYGPSNGNTGTTPIPGFCDANPFQASSGDVISLTNWVSGQYNQEISWDITDGSGTIIASGGTMVNGGGWGLPGTCIGNCASFTCTHTFNTYDAFGDGWNGASVDITVNGVTVLAGVYGPSNGNTGTTPIPGFCDANPFQASSGDAISLTNWVSGQYNQEISWDITDGNGTIIASGGTMVNGGGWGLPGNCIGNCGGPPPTPSWDCDISAGGCFDPGTGLGQYSSLSACQSACIVPSWECDPTTGGCYDPGNGQGFYNTLSACQSACAPTTSMNPDVPVQFMIFTDRVGLNTPNGTKDVYITTHPTNPMNYLNAGKIIRFKVGVQNKLSTNLTSADITLTPTFSDPYVTITANQNGLNNVPSNQVEFILNEFEITVDPTCPPGHIFYADFEVYNSITQSSYNSTAYPIVICPLVNLVPPSAMIDDDSNPDSNGDDDHIVDPNETIEITPQLQESSADLLNLLSIDGSSFWTSSFPGNEQPLSGCFLNINNYSYINIWDNVPGSSGANVVNCLPNSNAGPNSEWYIQPISGSDYLLPGYDFVFDFNNTSSCKFDLFVEFEAAITWHEETSGWSSNVYNDEIRWLTKLEINPNEPPCFSPTWDCDVNAGTCFDPGTGQGQYSSLAACQSACNIPVSYDCDATAGSCFDPGTGQGQYSSLAACQSACNIPASWYCINGACTDPGNGQGQYSSLAACQAACTVTPSWDCNNGNCTDPGNGQGQYSSLASCQSNCTNTNTSSYQISNKIFPNPFKEKTLLEMKGNSTQRVLLFDIMGQLLREYNDIKDNLIIERGTLSSGTYFLNIISENSSSIEKIVIE
jgi:hypothetical protein